VDVAAEQWGVSTRYIGAVEGSDRFDIRDLTDCGINTYRIFGGMPRFEREDDDGVYGSPSIQEIKSDPDAIRWDRWDEVMARPLYLSAAAEIPARKMFEQLRDARIRTVLCLRNKDQYMDPAWAPSVPRTEQDWNEWWEYVFATAYWLNVRNDYRVDDYEVLQEPNTQEQGWTGTQDEYIELLKRTKEAIDCVYKTYLPGRAYHIHAPVTAPGSPDWPLAVLRQGGEHFNCLSVHCEFEGQESLPRAMHQALLESGHAGYPLWLSQWGAYGRSYDEVDVPTALIRNLILGSRPGDAYVHGSLVFSFYDWFGRWGLVHGDGERSPGYYALRMACRALQGGRATFRTTCDTDDLLAVTTTGADGTVNLLVTNSSPRTTYHVTADLSGLLDGGKGTVRQVSSEVLDEVVGVTELTDGAAAFPIPPSAFSGLAGGRPSASGALARPHSAGRLGLVSRLLCPHADYSTSATKAS
jgi:hypothetical protein